MRENGARKIVQFPKQTFHISDDDGNTKNFTVQKRDGKFLYTIDDVEAVLDSMIEVIYESIRNGEQVNIRGFGSIGVKYHKPKIIPDLNSDNGGTIKIEGRYLPKLCSGHELRMHAAAYGAIAKERQRDDNLPIFNKDFDMGDD